MVKLRSRTDVRLCVAGLHINFMQGIAYDRASQAEGGGAYAVVISGGYGDDNDQGLEILYTGRGLHSSTCQLNVSTLCGIGDV
jgi:hypothetical protein